MKKHEVTRSNEQTRPVDSLKRRQVTFIGPESNQAKQAFLASCRMYVSAHGGRHHN